jgi:CelD/BcsL family acetyltransferase involved in cellulose biosynthesis
MQYGSQRHQLNQLLQLTVEALDNWDEVRLVYSDWRRILTATPSLAIFSTPEWLEPWWQSYGAGASLKFLVLRDAAGTIVAMAPLYVTVVDSIVGRLRLARLVGDGSGDSDNLGLICPPGNEDAVARAVLRWIAASSCCDVCQLNTLSFPNDLAIALKRLLRTPFWARSYFQQPQVAVTLPATWDEYLQQLSSKERGKIGNLARRLEKEFATEYVRISSPDDLDSRLDRLFELHRMRWARRNESGSFAITERRAFYRKVAAKFLQRGWLEFWFLELDKIQVAAQFAFAYRGVAYSLQEGFDPEYSSRSVGYVLRSHVLRRMIEVGMRKYDFLGGEGKSKLRWGGEQSRYLDIHIARRFSRGGAFLACRTVAHACKNLGHNILPPKIFGIVKALVRRNAQNHPAETQVGQDASAPPKRETQLQPARLSIWS